MWVSSTKSSQTSSQRLYGVELDPDLSHAASPTKVPVSWIYQVSITVGGAAHNFSGLKFKGSGFIELVL